MLFRLLVFLSLGAAAVTCSSSFAAETRDLILVAGQSNAVGFDAAPAELPADAADKDILFWWRCGDPLPMNSTPQDRVGPRSRRSRLPNRCRRPMACPGSTETFPTPKEASVRKWVL